MKVGFTGTQKGITQVQEVFLSKVLVELNKRGGIEFHHGDCIGADSQASMIANNIGYRIILHPPIISDKRAWCDYYEARPVKDYIERNHNIVDETEILVATPKGEEELRSGTWATIRYAKKQNKKIVIIYPNGVQMMKG